MSVVPEARNGDRAGGAQWGPCRRRADECRAGGAHVNTVPEARR
jgi:hypothetical protein